MIYIVECELSIISEPNLNPKALVDSLRDLSYILAKLRSIFTKLINLGLLVLLYPINICLSILTSHVTNTSNKSNFYIMLDANQKRM